MGILDDAIREHLALKRRQGAGEDELARLEGEAFGPPTRPGEPDFPAPEAGADEAAGEAERDADALVEPPSAADLEPEPVAPAIEAEAAPPAVATPPAPAPEPAAEAAVEPEGAEPRFYDHTTDDEIELDELDLELDEDVTSPAAPAEPEPAPIESLDTAEHPAPVESLDTVEHELEGVEEDEGDQGELLEGSVVDEDAEGEDVLEETPEFLRDQPEDDELWFEQGEPKDFDF